jgi:hypothetical protein
MCASKTLFSVRFGAVWCGLVRLGSRAPSSKLRGAKFGAWPLRLLRSLDVGAWSFGLTDSTENIEEPKFSRHLYRPVLGLAQVKNPTLCPYTADHNASRDCVYSAPPARWCELRGGVIVEPRTCGIGPEYGLKPTFTTSPKRSGSSSFALETRGKPWTSIHFYADSTIVLRPDCCQS